MSDFKFNFTVSDDENDRSEEIQEDDIEEESGPEAREVAWIPAQSPAVQTATPTRQHTFGCHTLVTLTSAAAEKSILQQKAEEDSSVAKAIAGHTDLIAGQYEGGLKVWECCLDLCQYLVERGEGEGGVEGSQVLDLGCGAGLPGLLALRMKALSVHFQDFNPEVLESYTMKNVDLNGLTPGSCKFFSGDWSSFASFAEEQNHRYDLILTAETIYNVRSYSKLLKVFSSLLAKGGAVLLAAKNIYFGVGGSVFSFVDYLKKAGPQFTVETVKEIGADIPRKILKLTKT